MNKLDLINSWKMGNELRNSFENVDYNFKLYLDKYYYNYEFYNNDSKDMNVIIKYLYDEKYNIPESGYIKDRIKLYLSKMVSIANNNVDLLKKEYEKQRYYLGDFTLQQNGKMVVGLGNADVKESTMDFHHTYGIPYIPGQAIKGVCRNYIISKYFDLNEGEALQDEGFIKIFGASEKNKSSIGDVVFFDSFPEDKIISLKKDVMSVHYKKYYNLDEQGIPSDDSEPNVITFLTVENSKFRFVIASKEDIKNLKLKGNSISLENELKNALTNFGIGAKTSVGYGYFK